MRAILSVLFAAGMLLVGCTSEPQAVPTGARAADARTEKIDRALALAMRYLLDAQSADGAWRSDTYAAFKDGRSLTPLAVEALRAMPPSEKVVAACSRGKRYLASLVNSDGTIDYGAGPNYPIYIAALAVRVLSGSGNDEHSRARHAWLADLRRRQLTEELGWQPSDLPYGGWGYCPVVPHKPTPDEFSPPFIESNLSATLFALEALQAAEVAEDDPVWKKALVFVQRCQNYSAEPNAESEFEDGGFFFIYEDPVRNKAGVAGHDATGRIRFHSYGSTTSDGIRALLLCGTDREDPRLRAAVRWLDDHFAADQPPGVYAQRREIDRQAIYFYYCASVSRTFRRLGIQQVNTPSGSVRWDDWLADALIGRQLPDGSWSNPYHAYREDDPLSATCLAIIALANSRRTDAFLVGP